MDRIFIRDLALRCIIGIFPEERREKQDIVINIEMHTDLRRAGRSDNLADTVDYKAIKKAVLKLVEESDFLLIEALAENVARIALNNEKVQQVVVTIDKPGALRFARSSAVEITRKRG
jgi:dihydroneopterin aldolase/D-erythro-7,8-dihydroneopterin triphosphate epimerase